MTNTNREEWPTVVKELRHLAALLYNGGTPAPQQSGLDVDAAATLIENQGREIERKNEFCPFCAHEWRRHDPEDGMCDAPKEGGWSVCPCGRDLDWMHSKVAVLSRAALNRRVQSPTQAPLQEGATK